jgi:hypothetical protein
VSGKLRRQQIYANLYDRYPLMWSARNFVRTHLGFIITIMEKTQLRVFAGLSACTCVQTSYTILTKKLRSFNLSHKWCDKHEFLMFAVVLAEEISPPAHISR